MIRLGLFILFFVSYQPVLAQCHTASEWLQQISVIEGSEQPHIEKIRQLEVLLAEVQRCTRTKDSIYARIVHRLGDEYRLTGDFRKGIGYTREAVAINRHAGAAAQTSYLVHSYYNLGIYYSQLYLIPESHIYFDSCIFFGLQYAEKKFIALMAYGRKAFLYFNAGDYQKSIDIAKAGILLSGKIQDPLSGAVLLAQEAQAQLFLDQDEAAAQNIKTAIRVLQDGNGFPEDLATSFSVYAAVMKKKKDFSSAIGYYKKAAALNLSQNNLPQYARDMMDLGYLYDRELGNVQQALACYRQAMDNAVLSNDIYLQLGLYINTGVVYWRKKDYRQALDHYQKALNILPVQFKDTGWAHNPEPGKLKLVANDYYVSTLLANKAEALMQLYKEDRNTAWLQAALQTFEMADKAVDMMRWKQQSEQSKLFWRQKVKGMYEKAIEACYQQQDMARAFYFFEKSRAVLLNDRLTELGAKNHISPADRVAEQQIRIRYTSLQRQLENIPETDAAYGKLYEQFSSAQHEWEQFIRGIEKKYPLYYQYKFADTVIAFRHACEKLQAEGQSLLEYFTGDTTLYILSVIADKGKLTKIPVSDFNQYARELLAICSDQSAMNRNYSQYRALAYKLYHILFQPLSVPKGRVVISPDEQFIPFEVLLSEEKNSNSFLLRDYAFSYTYSTGLLFREKTGNGKSGHTFLGIAPVNYQSYMQQPALKGADVSVQTISNNFNSADQLLGAQASRRKFLNSFPEYRIVQLYSHAYADSSGAEPVLYLNDSAIYLSEIQDISNIHTELIVLSACQTGLGKNAQGEGVFSLARGFSAAGIPGAITTLWQIDNQSTYQLTELFYKYLQQGQPKDVALQQAKLEFIAGHEKMYELPYFWAASIMLGNTNAIKEEKRSNHLVIYLAVFVVVAGVVWWRIKA